MGAGHEGAGLGRFRVGLGRFKVLGFSGFSGSLGFLIGGLLGLFRVDREV